VERGAFPFSSPRNGSIWLGQFDPEMVGGQMKGTVVVGKVRERTRETVGSEEERKLVFLTQAISLIMTDKSVSLLMNHFPGI